LERKSPPGTSGRASDGEAGWAASKLNGALNLLPSRVEGYVSRMSEATLLNGFRAQFAEIGGIRLRWFEAGEGEPIVLVHGLGGAATNWTLLAPLLAERRRVLVPDLPGHAASEPPPRRADLRWYAETLAELLVRREAAPAAVIGHSMGGVVAMRLAARRPDLVASLALVGSAGIASLTRAAAAFFTLSGLLKPARKAARFRARIAQSDRLKRLVFGYWGAHDPASMSSEGVLGWLEWAGAHGDTATAARALLRDDPRYDIDRISCPTRVVWGARDRLVTVEDGFEFARRLRAPIRVVAGAGHLVIAERPDECAVIIEDFLNGVRKVDELPVDAELVCDPG
jgi:magnesium chelatase accessory protein